MMIFFLSILLSSFVFAGKLPPMACPEKVSAFLKEWKSSNEWQEENESGFRKSFYASPTDKIGEWILVRRIPQGTVMSRAQKDGRIEVMLDEKNCKPVTKFYPHPKAIGVNDKELSDFVQKNRTGAIYVWSPRMDLSKNGIREIQAAARSQKLPLLILLDKDVPPSEKVKLEKELGKDLTRTVDSFELNMRHVQIHFPALLVFKDRKIRPGVKYGYEKADRYQLDLRELLR